MCEGEIIIGVSFIIHAFREADDEINIAILTHRPFYRASEGKCPVHTVVLHESSDLGQRML